jgi:hypothetical protein
MGIAYSYKRGIVTVTADNGTSRDWPLKTFEADPASCVAQTGNGIALPEPVITTDEKIAALEKENAALREVLIGKAIITKSEVDLKRDAIAAEPIAKEIKK